ncbi:MAG: hypothetical protein ACRD0K_12110 [Egibacteraceae bacterium]
MGIVLRCAFVGGIGTAIPSWAISAANAASLNPLSHNSHTSQSSPSTKSRATSRSLIAAGTIDQALTSRERQDRQAEPTEPLGMRAVAG